MAPPDKSIDAAIGGAGGVHFFNGILTEFGAPKLGELKECNAPEVPEFPNHLANTILNSIFLSIEFPPSAQPYVLNFLRRMETAVSEYRLGRLLLMDYVQEVPRRNNHFLRAMRALSHFEQSAAALYQAAELTRPITKMELFKKGDGSPMDHLNKIYNRSRHFEQGVGEPGPPPAVPVWLTNEGLECPNCTLTFAEMHEIIVDLTKCAELVAIELPKHVEEKRKASAGNASASQSPDA